MTIRKIARMGHPVLRRRADEVDDPTSPAIAELVADMLETVTDAGGAGLAAPQVHEPLRVVIFEAPPTRADSTDPMETCPRTIIVNPVIEPLGTERQTGWEGCLSVPGLRGLVSRAQHIVYRGVNLDGAPIEREAKGFHARVVQHECDHLDGVLYPQRMDDLSDLIFESEWRHYLTQANEAESERG